MNGIIRAAFRQLRHRSRRKRYEFINRLLEVERASGLMLDLGGGPASFFSAMFSRPEQIILVDLDFNLVRRARRMMPALHTVVADGSRLPFADHSIGVTVCNSVIEHVDDPDSLAQEIQRVSCNYFIQTPNGRFPLETHSFIAIPFYNLVRGNRLARLVCKLFGANFEYVNSVRYLSELRLRTLFPYSRIAYERVLGLKKSFYIYRRSGDPK
jgi:SAM-dependent methyltransferase